MNTRAIVPGSIAAVAESKNISIAESFLSADAIIIVDVSGSMASRDSREGKSRYDVGLEELARLQRTMPGKVAVVAFSDRAEFVPGGVPPFIGGGTDLTAALKFVQCADGLVRFVLVSDGQPDNPEAALRTVRGFTSRIDVVFVGPENDPYEGRSFLEKLAALRKGQFVTADRATELANKVETLLLTTR